MSNITDLAIKGRISKLNAGEGDRHELREGAGRGNGRLTIVIRRGAEGVTSEWYAVWHREGRRQTTKMGTYPTMTLAEARKAFREDYEPEILAGRNPTGPRSWIRHRDATVRDLFEAYVESLEAAGCRPGSVRSARYALLGPSGAADAIGAMRPAREITKNDLIPFLKRIHDRGSVYQANHVRSWLRSAFEYGLKSVNTYHQAASAIDWGLTHNPAAAIALDKKAFKPRERVLSEAEFVAYWNWLTAKGANLKYRYAPAIQLMMATGQRPSEILQLGPANFDSAEGTLQWAVTKNDLPHCIPLPSLALAILMAAEADEYGHFFPAQRKQSCHVASVTCEWYVDRYLTETGAQPFVTRDLRRTWKTLAGKAGLSKEIRDRLQNHKLPGVSAKHYDKYNYFAEKKAAMEQWGRFMAELLTGDPEGEVQFARPVRVKRLLAAE
jgi:integrase